ncbi:MAG TPA: alpha/beta fold hydrolase [Fimbriimonadaceae bacterium]|nr:alpha/beta fold hydrolase [Fimbriimonadaceae bacterium]
MLLALGLCSLIRLQGDLSGSWTGVWTKAGDSLPVAVTFRKMGDTYSGFFDSDSLQVAGIPFQKVSCEGDHVTILLQGDATTTNFDGSLSGNELSGRFKDGDVEGTFRLTRSAVDVQPQEKEVDFANGHVRLVGTEVLPRGKGRHPAILFLHGSGPEGRWASRYLAWKFAQAGFVALIYDQRGVGQSTGDWKKSSFDDFAKDALAGIRRLESLPEVDARRIGIYGHSQGATVAPMIAAKDTRLGFVIASAGSGLTPAETETYSLENSLGVPTLPAKEKSEARRFVRAIVDVGYRGHPWSGLTKIVEPFKGRSWFFQPPPADNYYWAFSKRIASHRPLSFWKRVKAPVLLTYGTLDERVPTTSADLIAKTLRAAGNRKVAVKPFPGADHTFTLVQPSSYRGWPKKVGTYAATLIDWARRAR